MSDPNYPPGMGLLPDEQAEWDERQRAREDAEADRDDDER